MKKLSGEKFALPHSAVLSHGALSHNASALPHSASHGASSHGASPIAFMLTHFFTPSFRHADFSAVSHIPILDAASYSGIPA
jgi:hypothetical protein